MFSFVDIAPPRLFDGRLLWVLRRVAALLGDDEMVWRDGHDDAAPVDSQAGAREVSLAARAVTHAAVQSARSAAEAAIRIEREVTATSQSPGVAPGVTAAEAMATVVFRTAARLRLTHDASVIFVADAAAAAAAEMAVSVSTSRESDQDVLAALVAGAATLAAEEASLAVARAATLSARAAAHAADHARRSSSRRC
jgi:hypothetical protein